MPLLLLILLFAALGGIASAAFAVVFLWVREEHSVRILPHFISFATGALIGAALLALLPEAIEGAGTAGARRIGAALVVGLAVFFVIEKLVLWWHAHAHERSDEASACPQHADDPTGGHAPGQPHSHRTSHDHARDRASG
ncbi:MAG: ZIP family metal transporter, partial [Gammaproteobacteria bacterium]|nr:ZIP family metal transporter [Gammaproteobacteria bacterium]